MNTITLSGKSYSFAIYNSVNQIKDEWNTSFKGVHYSHSNYLSLLERSGPIGYNYYYVIVKQDGQAMALYYFQRKEVHLSKDFRIHTHDPGFLSKLRVSLMKNFFKLVKHQILICGNVLLTGEYGQSKLDQEGMVHGLTDSVIAEVKSYIQKQENKKIQSILFKDFYKDEGWSKDKFDATGFTEVTVQPDMIIPFKKEWLSFEDYMAAVKSKYRVKFKKVLKKAKALEFRELNLEETERYNDTMYALYKETADRALFSLFLLHPKYFLDLKKTFEDNIILTGVFLDEKLVGFYTFIDNGEMADAHFLGYDVKLNSKHQLYFNILLRLLTTGIERRVSYLNLSRTALEIKSSVGAEPHDMAIYLRSENKLINKFLPKILDKTVPKNNWVQRSPFK